MIAQLKKGVLEYCVLIIISSNELYGYEIMKQVTEIFPDTSEQTIYTILRRLLSEGYTDCYSKGISAGPPRKYYKLTDKGIDYHKQCEKDWKYVCECVDALTPLNPIEFR